MTSASDYYRVAAQISEGRDSRDLPGPWRHAARPGDEETLCGSPLDGLLLFEHLPYDELDPVMRCRVCGVTFDRLIRGL